MIPDYLIDKAAQAIVTGMGGESLLADMHPEDAGYARADARAALEAVAPHIFQHGYNLGRTDELLHQAGIDTPETPNPYKAPEGT